MRFEERTPLEMGNGSSASKIYVCPHCNVGQFRSKNFFSGSCISCRKYFRASDSRSEDEMIDLESPTIIPINKAKVAQKAYMEKMAYEFKDTTNQKRRDGTQRSHEPDGKARRW